MKPNRIFFVHPSAFLLHAFHIAEFLEQCFEFVATAVNVPDDIEWTVFIPLVVKQRHSLDCRCFGLFGA